MKGIFKRSYSVSKVEMLKVSAAMVVRLQLDKYLTCQIARGRGKKGNNCGQTNKFFNDGKENVPDGRLMRGLNVRYLAVLKKTTSQLKTIIAIIARGNNKGAKRMQSA